MYNDVIKKTRIGMDKAIESFKKDVSKVRTGRASITLLDDVMVDYYGTPTALNQVATLSVPESRLITVQPWEKKLLPDIEKAIFKSDIGLTPSSDGQIIRLVIPPMTEERRKEMGKMVRKMGEDAKVSARGARRDGNDSMKKLEKNKEISEDDLKRGEKEIQDLTDSYVVKIDELVANKEKEIMAI